MVETVGPQDPSGLMGAYHAKDPKALRRLLATLTIIALLSVGLAPAVQADLYDPRVIEADVFGAAALPESRAPYSLLIQATSWIAGGRYYYLVTLSNLSPWTIRSAHVLDRYFPQDPEQAEIANEYYAEWIEPAQSAAFAIMFEDGPLPGACHQLELNFADALVAILMDCARPNSTAVWNVPLREELADRLVVPEVVEEPQEPEVIEEPAPKRHARSGDAAMGAASVAVHEPTIATRRSLLGLHVTRNSSPDIMEFVRDAQPSVVVAVGDLGWLAEVKNVSPKTVTIGRLIEGDQSINGDPRQRARDFVSVNRETYLSNPGVDYWLGWNEPGLDEIWHASWYAAFEAERAKAMAEIGLKVAIGNFSAGTPEATEFEAFVPAVAAAQPYGAILAVHEYSAPYMTDGVGAGIPGIEGDPDLGALTLRYRYWYEHYLLPRELAMPMVVTEAGIDGGVLKADGFQLLGWRDFAGPDIPDTMVQQTASEYVEQLSWYDDELRRDPYVLGFAIFNVGDPDGKWASFDMTDMLPALGELVQSKN